MRTRETSIDQIDGAAHATAQHRHVIHRVQQAQRHPIPMAATALVPAVPAVKIDDDSDGLSRNRKVAIAAASTTDQPRHGDLPAAPLAGLRPRLGGGGPKRANA